MNIPDEFKPMLASALKDGAMPRFPCYASPKLDGVRAAQFGGTTFSRNLKAIPNKHVQKLLKGFKTWLDQTDGELIVGPPTSPTAFRDTSSGVMAVEGEPDVVFWVFDIYWPDAPFEERLEHLRSHLKNVPPAIQLVPQTLVSNEEELKAFEEKCLAEGYEGAMVRSTDGPYKHGRSTVKEGYLLKVKRFEDGEAEILEAVELEHNENAKALKAMGKGKRSTHKAGMVAGGVLGSLRVRDCSTGVVFNIGSGFDAAERKRLWDVREKLPGQLAKYRYFPTGSKTAPRFPTWLGFRDRNDL